MISKPNYSVAILLVAVSVVLFVAFVICAFLAADNDKQLRRWREAFAIVMQSDSAGSHRCEVGPSSLTMPAFDASISSWQTYAFTCQEEIASDLLLFPKGEIPPQCEVVVTAILIDVTDARVLWAAKGPLYQPKMWDVIPPKKPAWTMTSFGYAIEEASPNAMSLRDSSLNKYAYLNPGKNYVLYLIVDVKANQTFSYSLRPSFREATEK